jgi:DNA polymerase III subunit epsilon
MRSHADAGGCFPTGRHYAGIAHLLRAQERGTADEFAADTPMSDLPLVAIDTETTGRDPVEDRIVEVACVVFHRGSVTHHSWLVNPGRPIPAEAQEVHKISDADVADKPPLALVLPEIMAVLMQAVPLAYNAEFDRAFLNAEYTRAMPLGLPPEQTPPALRRGVQWLDPLVWARELQRDEKSRSLSEVAERLGIELKQAHRATDDAEAAGRVLFTMFGDPRVPATYGAFAQEQRRLDREHREERARWRSTS